MPKKQTAIHLKTFENPAAVCRPYLNLHLFKASDNKFKTPKNKINI